MCEFCKDNNVEQTWERGGVHDFRIHENAIFYYDDTLGWEGIKINYCPMCGERLEQWTKS